MSNGTSDPSGFWDFVRGLFVRERTEYSAVDIPLDRIHPALPDTKAKADTHYFRLRVGQMWLRNERELFTRFEPAVHSVVACSFADRQMEITNIADTARLGLTYSGEFIGRNFILLPLMPFRGGAVRIAAGLYAVAREDMAARFLGVISDVAKVFVVPQLSTMLELAQPVAKGLQALFTDPQGMRLGYHNTFFGATETTPVLQQRYIALVRAAENEVPAADLFVDHDQLRVKDGSVRGAPYTRHDFMLLRIDVQSERDDISQFTSIEKPMMEAFSQIVEGNEDGAKKAYLEAVRAAINAPELTAADRRRVPLMLKERFEEMRRDFSGAGLMPRALPVDEAGLHPLDQAMMNVRISADTALQLPEPTLDDFMV